MTVGAMLLAELIGTAILVFFGNGTCMTVSMKRSHGSGGGWISIVFGWGLGVAIAVYFSGWISGAHLNPAVSVAMACMGAFEWSMVPGYVAAQLIGAMIGATTAYLLYKDAMDLEENVGAKLGVFCTGPAVDNKPWNVVSEMIGTFILIFGILSINQTENGIGAGMGPFLVGMLIVVIGIAAGGATGYAINPARDLGPRLMHAILPIKGKGDSNWGYAWVPIVGPLLGAPLAAFAFMAFRAVVAG